jgi:hypothetical protein
VAAVKNSSIRSATEREVPADISTSQLQPSEVANIGRLARGEPLHNVVHGG